jgi:hypothetical protein
MALSYADRMDEITVMIDGCTAHQERLSKRGLTQELMTRFIEQHGKVRRINSDQEALKARLKEKSAELEAELAILFEIASEIRKVIKLEMPQESWKEFGIQAKG